MPRPSVIRKTFLVSLCLTMTLNVVTPARASSICSSVLTDKQLREFEMMVFPSRPYSPDLSEADPGGAVQGAVKRLTGAQIEKLRPYANPYVVAVRNVLSQQDVAPLKQWLTSNPSTDLPAWESTLVGIIVPGAWIARTADDFPHLMNERGDAGPISATSLGSAASQAKALGVTQHLAADSSGKLKFLWAYVYEATLRGQLITTLLAICQADVVTIDQSRSASLPDDEQELRALQQQLARAWAKRDRETIERILAPEWSVTTPEGTTLAREAVLDAAFGSNAPSITAMTTDDVTVTRFDSAAVVRGRTVAILVPAGTPQTIAIRFTDLCIKRDGTWQVVASHQTRVP